MTTLKGKSNGSMRQLSFEDSLRRWKLQLQSGNETEPLVDEAGVNSTKKTKRKRVILPDDLFLELARYFPTGSRTLLHLASASKQLYALLFPRLLRSLDSRRIAAPALHLQFRREKLAILGNHVKTLELFNLPSSGGDADARVSLENRRDVVRACSQSLRAMSIDMDVGSGIDSATWPLDLPFDCVFANVLNLDVHHVSLPTNIARVFPNVRQLSIRGPVLSDPPQPHTAVWARVSEFRSLEELEVKLNPWQEQFFLEHVRLDRGLLRKIKSWIVEDIQSFLELTKFPEFQPERISFSDDNGFRRPNDPPRFPFPPREHLLTAWATICKMKSVKEIGPMSVWSIEFFALGFPPNVETLRDFEIFSDSTCFQPRKANKTRIKDAISKLPPDFKPRCFNFLIDVGKRAERSSLKWINLVEELGFWDWFARDWRLWCGDTAESEDDFELHREYDSDGGGSEVSYDWEERERAWVRDIVNEVKSKRRAWRAEFLATSTEEARSL